MDYCAVYEPTLESVCTECELSKSRKWEQQWKPTNTLRQLVTGNVIVPQRVGTVCSPKEETLIIPIKVHFQRADSLFITFHFYTDKKKKSTYDPSDTVVFMSTDKNLRNSQGRLWCCIPLLFRYINNQIWRAANKNRINIISILINLQATGLEKPSETEQREISMCNVSPPAVCPLAVHYVLPAPLPQNTLQRDFSVF